MNAELSKAAKCYGLYDGNDIIGFCGVIHFPHPNNPKIKKCSRLVVLPDYQGIGLGMKLLNFVADKYTEMGFDFTITTSAKNMVMTLHKSKLWLTKKYGVEKKRKTKLFKDSRNVKTGTFKFKKRRNSQCQGKK